MKQIQEWLGHSDFSTTANIYSHLDYTAKLNSAETLVTSLDFASEAEPSRYKTSQKGKIKALFRQ